jgi:hypothetical protein
MLRVRFLNFSLSSFAHFFCTVCPNFKQKYFLILSCFMFCIRNEGGGEMTGLAATWGEETHLELFYIASTLLLIFLLIHMVRKPHKRVCDLKLFKMFFINQKHYIFYILSHNMSRYPTNGFLKIY